MAITKRVHHIGIVVDDLEEALAFFTGVLGLEVGKRGENPARKLRAAFIPLGDLELELIEFDNTPESVAPGTGRIDHLAIEVDDVDAVAPVLAEHGVTYQTDEPLEAMGYRFLFTNAESSDGITLQVLQVLK